LASTNDHILEIKYTFHRVHKNFDAVAKKLYHAFFKQKTCTFTEKVGEKNAQAF